MLKTLATAAVLLALAACGSDSSTSASAVPSYPSLQGVWYANWTTQYNRTRDNYNGSYQCPGQLTINHDPRKSTFTGFAVVSQPCPPLSFDLSGTIDSSKGVHITMAGPRPGAGTCPQFPVSGYTGSLVDPALSLRANATVNCPGTLEGEYTFSILLSARKTSS